MTTMPQLINVSSNIDGWTYLDVFGHKALLFCKDGYFSLYTHSFFALASKRDIEDLTAGPELTIPISVGREPATDRVFIVVGGDVFNVAIRPHIINLTADGQFYIGRGTMEPVEAPTRSIWPRVLLHGIAISLGIVVGIAAMRLLGL